MRKFLLHFFAFISLPSIIITMLIVLYILADPYMDFNNKTNFSWKYSFQELGDIATKKLINSEGNYNSFILGSSRTVGLYACYLNKTIKDARFFHYGNCGETIGGIKEKLELVDSLGLKIENVFIYLDTDNTFLEDGNCRKSDHYLFTNKTKFDYVKSHFLMFYNNLTKDKIKILLHKEISGEIFPNWTSDSVTNDSYHNCQDPKILSEYSKIRNDAEFINYIDSLKSIGFYSKRPTEQQYKNPQISKEEEMMLKTIKSLFNKHQTNYFIVITPVFDQLKFNKIDHDLLLEIFGSRLFDFSGKNYFTNYEYNYPDERHFQPYISKCIADSVLTK